MLIEQPALPIRVIVNGAHGRMGQEAVKAIQNTTSLILVGETDKNDDLHDAIVKTQAQVVVDFTSAMSAAENTATILKAKAYPVIGTSGLMSKDIHQLQALALTLNQGGIIVPNFSVGAVLMLAFAEKAARYFPFVEIIERHHPDKKDAPSQTALRTAEKISQIRQTQPISIENTEKLLIPGARGGCHEGVPIHSLRLSGSCAHQTVLFGGLDETLSIQHDTLTRKSFMPGLILACEKVHTLKTLVIGLEHLLSLD